MPDEVKQTFVRSFINDLKKQINSQAFTPDAQESCEVAIQCLQAAFDLGDEEAEEQSQLTATAGGAAATTDVKPKEVSLFELYELHYLERNPDTLKAAEAIKNEGNRLMKDGKYNEALLQYNRAITYDPKNPIFYCNRAAAHIRLGDNNKAIVDCKSALVYNQNYGKAYGRLGIAYSNLGKYEEAQQAYAKAIELEPDNQDYRNNLEVARNARTPAISGDVLPQLTESILATISNPAIRGMFGNDVVDLDTLQSMVHNPTVMNALGQLFSGMQQGGGMGGGGMPGVGAGNAIPPNSNDMMQLFQSLATQLSGAAAGQQQPQNPGNNPPNNDSQQPPSN